MSRKDLKRFGCLLAAAVPVFWYIFAGFAWSAENPSASHFPSSDISFTDSSAVYYIHLKIDGLPGQAGDEVAFFDPRGKICGWASVESAAEFQVAVYGDDTSTEAAIEGAKAGEVLTVKVWDASAGLEFSGAALALSGGVLPGIDPAAIPPIWGGNNLSYVLDIDTAMHFGKPTSIDIPYASYYHGHVSINGVPAAVGDELAVFDQNGILCGLARIMDQGAYGITAVYGDDTTTPQVDEGAVEGEKLTFKIWDRSANREYGGGDLRLTQGLAQGDSVPSVLPPIWSYNKGYVLDIDAAVLTKGDVNGDNRVDMGDAILALKVCVGFALAYPDVYQQADVNGDGRIGMEEAVYILQKAAALR